MARRLLIIGLGVLLLSVAFWIHRRSPERSRPISPPIEPTTKRSAAQPPGQAPEAGRPAQAQATQPDGPAGRGLLKDWAEIRASCCRAVELPQCRFIDENEPDAFSRSSPLTSMIAASQLLQLDAVAEPDRPEAGDAIRAALHLAGAVEREPTVLAQILAVSVEDSSMRALQMYPDLLLRPEIAGSVERMDPASVRRSYAQSLIGELCF